MRHLQNVHLESYMILYLNINYYIKGDSKNILEHINNRCFYIMTSLPPYKARKSDPVSVPLNEPIEFSAIDWYECDLTVDTPIERKDSYLNQDHNKTYTIFIFGFFNFFMKKLHTYLEKYGILCLNFSHKNMK